MSATDIKYDYESEHVTVTDDDNQNYTNIGKLHAKLCISLSILPCMYVCMHACMYSQLRLIEILLIGISGNGLAVKP